MKEFWKAGSLPLYEKGNIAATAPVLQTEHKAAAADCQEQLSKSSPHFSGVGRVFVQCLPRKEIMSKFSFPLNSIKEGIKNKVVKYAEQSVLS